MCLKRINQNELPLEGGLIDHDLYALIRGMMKGNEKSRMH